MENKEKPNYFYWAVTAIGVIGIFLVAKNLMTGPPNGATASLPATGAAAGTADTTHNASGRVAQAVKYYKVTCNLQLGGPTPIGDPSAAIYLSAGTIIAGTTYKGYPISANCLTPVSGPGLNASIGLNGAVCVPTKDHPCPATGGVTVCVPTAANNYCGANNPPSEGGGPVGYCPRGYIMNAHGQCVQQHFRGTAHNAAGGAILTRVPLSLNASIGLKGPQQTIYTAGPIPAKQMASNPFVALPPTGEHFGQAINVKGQCWIWVENLSSGAGEWMRANGDLRC